MTPPNNYDDYPVKTEDLSENHVIARAKPVAISCYIVRILTQYQEIATPLRARNDRGSI